MRAGWFLICAITMMFPGWAVAQPLQPPADPIQRLPAVEPQPIPVASAPADAPPLRRWWFDTSLEFGWIASRPSPQTIRLRPHDSFGNRIPPITLALDGQQTPLFSTGLGFHVGRWLDDNQVFGLEAGGFFLPGAVQSIQTTAPRTLVLFPDGPGRSAPVFLRVPRSLGDIGTAFPSTAVTSFDGVELNLRAGLLITDSARLDLLVGYRFAYLEDELFLGDEPMDGRDGYRANRMTVENTFHGGQIGLGAHYRADAWYADGIVKLAYGAVTTQSAASGAFLFSEQPIALRTDMHGAFLPSFNLRLGYRFTQRSSIFAGYNFQYLNHAGRLGEAFAPGGGTLQVSNFWVQSLSLGFECRF